MRFAAAILVGVLFIACSSTKETEQYTPPPITKDLPPPPPSGDIPPSPAVVKENMSLIGAVVRSVTLTDSAGFFLDVEIRTAVPAGTGVSLAEPGQMLRLHPDFSDHAVRNARLRDLRTKREGDFLLGRIFLDREGTWRLYDTTFSER